MSILSSDLSLVFEAIPIPAVLIDAGGAILDINQVFLDRAQRHGYDLRKEIWVGQPVWAFAPEPNRSRFETFVRRALAQEGIAPSRERFAYELKTTIHTEISITPLQDPAGQALGALVLWQDITGEVWQAQRQQLAARVRDEVWRMQSSRDMEGVLIAVRNGLEELRVPFNNCGVNLVDSAADPLQVHFHSMTEEGVWLPSPDVPGTEIVLQIWRSQQVAYRQDLDREDRYGETALMAANFDQHIRSVVDVPFAQGTLAVNSTLPEAFSPEDLEILQEMAQVLSEGFQRLGDFLALEQRNRELEREVVERQQAETSLRLIQFTLEHASEAVIWFGVDGRIFYANKAACRSLGYTREELLSLTIRDIDPDFPPQETWAQVWERIRTQPQPRNRETRHRARDGRVFPVEITATYLEFDGREYVCTFARDITARKHLEEQLLQAQKMEAIGQLTAGIAHNFNNMLQAVLGNLSLALERAPASLRSFLQEAEASANRAADMVRQLMVFSRPAIALAPHLVDLRLLLQRTLDICRRTFDQSLRLQAELPIRLPVVEGNPGHLEQVLLNLLLNARDALEGVRRPERHITTSLAVLSLPAGQVAAGLPPGEYVRLQVSDNGTGMDESTRARIFEPFFTTKEVGEGTGLGLTVSQQLAAKYGVGLEINAKEGAWAEVRLRIPYGPNA